MHDDDFRPPPQFIKPPDPLSGKVRPYGGPTPEEAIERAERSALRMRGEFVASLDEEVAALEALFRVYQADRSPETLQRIFRIAHNLRGLGATFHYDLMTRLGTSMCRYITELPEGRTLEPAILHVHIQAMKAVARAHMEGAGDRVSRGVAETLSLIVRKATGEP